MSILFAFKWRLDNLEVKNLWKKRKNNLEFLRSFVCLQNASDVFTKNCKEFHNFHQLQLCEMKFYYICFLFFLRAKYCPIMFRQFSLQQHSKHFTIYNLTSFFVCLFVVVLHSFSLFRLHATAHSNRVKTTTTMSARLAKQNNNNSNKK